MLLNSWSHQEEVIIPNLPNQLDICSSCSGSIRSGHLWYLSKWQTLWEEYQAHRWTKSRAQIYRSSQNVIKTASGVETTDLPRREQTADLRCNWLIPLLCFSFFFRDLSCPTSIIVTLKGNRNHLKKKKLFGWVRCFSDKEVVVIISYLRYSNSIQGLDLSSLFWFYFSYVSFRIVTVPVESFFFFLYIERKDNSLNKTQFV